MAGVRAPILLLTGIAGIGASAVAGIAMGNYTTAGASSFYTENYRAVASRDLADDGTTAQAFWDAQGLPRAVPAPQDAAYYR